MSTRFVWNKNEIENSVAQGDQLAAVNYSGLHTMKAKITDSIDNLDFIYNSTNSATGTLSISAPTETIDITTDEQQVTVKQGEYVELIGIYTFPTEYEQQEAMAYAETGRAILKFRVSSPRGFDIVSGTLVKVSAARVPGSLISAVSNAASSTYPLNNSRPEAAIICAISAALLRRCSRVN